MIPPAQRETAAFLEALAGGPPVETHISAVYVGADTAWKLKKAVALNFLDFTATDTRERFCRRELELNRPAAPGIYRDVVPVTRRPDGTLRLGGDGPALDWVLRMAPIPPGDFLDAVAAGGGLTPALIDATADAVAALHDIAPPAEADPVATMSFVLEGNIPSARDAGLDPARIGAWASAARKLLARLAPRLAERGRQGFVRRCHGDLHLGNLCLWEGRPTAFDALEFDEALACIDTGYDLAFLLMDLELRLGRPAANRALNRYVARRGDAGLVAGLPLWLSLRAMVRAHVTAARGGDAAALLAAAEAHLRPAPACLVAVGGLQGTGKSTLARALAPGLGPAPGALVLRSDEQRKRRFGVPPERRLPEAAYTQAVSAAVHAELFALARAALAGGHAVVLDGMFLDPAHRASAEAVAREAGLPFHGLWLEAPLATLKARLAARQGDASDATEEVLLRAAAVDPGPLAWHRLAAERDPLAEAKGLVGKTSHSMC